jgi:CRP/FNR family cyclic AMP-dependent transcriptional regulator
MKMKGSKKASFDVESFLKSAGIGRTVKALRKGEVIFSQGDPARHLMYVRDGGVKLSVVSHSGKEAVVGILGMGDFFGEWCLADQPIYIATATAILPTNVVVIKKEEMLRVLHTQHALSDRFISYMLSRVIRLEEDLINQLFNSTEQRLARALLILARYGKQAQPNTKLPKISQQMLAEMIGTTRTQVNLFMNKFRKLGYIDYDGSLMVHRSLLSVVLHD